MPRTASMPDSTLADGGVSINGVSVNGGSVRGAVPGAAAALKRLFKVRFPCLPWGSSRKEPGAVHSPAQERRIGRLRRRGVLQRTQGSVWQPHVFCCPSTHQPTNGSRPPFACSLQEDLGVEPTDESKAYITFLVPKAREPQLPAFLQQLDDKRQQVRRGGHRRDGCLRFPPPPTPPHPHPPHPPPPSSWSPPPHAAHPPTHPVTPLFIHFLLLAAGHHRRADLPHITGGSVLGDCATGGGGGGGGRGARGRDGGAGRRRWQVRAELVGPQLGLACACSCVAKAEAMAGGKAGRASRCRALLFPACGMHTPSLPSPPCTSLPM